VICIGCGSYLEHFKCIQIGLKRLCYGGDQEQWAFVVVVERLLQGLPIF
jgi:hypothetical protein